MNKFWTGKEQVMNKSWTRHIHEQVVRSKANKKSTIPAGGWVVGWEDHTGNNANSAPNWVGVRAWAKLGKNPNWIDLKKHSHVFCTVGIPVIENFDLSYISDCFIWILNSELFKMLRHTKKGAPTWSLFWWILNIKCSQPVLTSLCSFLS